MPGLDRRQTLVGGAASLAALALHGPAVARPRRRSDELRAAVIGFRSRGRHLLDALRRQEGVRVVALCDVDEEVLGREAARLAEAGEPVDTTTDMRRIFDRARKRAKSTT
jgi:FlaA1/EpsC-like NDP-sugar epimerase